MIQPPMHQSLSSLDNRPENLLFVGRQSETKSDRNRQTGWQLNLAQRLQSQIKSSAMIRKLSFNEAEK